MTTVLFSGGMDSTVLLHLVLSRVPATDIVALSFDYGQRHVKELGAAKRLTESTEVQHRVVNVQDFGANVKSSQTSGHIEVPEGHFADKSMKATIVPNRNMVMLAIAAGVCLSGGGGEVWYGAHDGDHAIYPDCRPVFVERLNEVLKVADWNPVQVVAPFLQMTKAEIVSLGASLGVPFADTWSCYKGGDLHCAKCGTCVERIEAFEVAGVPDPTIYAV